MAISNPLMIIVNPKGIQLTHSGDVIASPNNTARIVCPAVILANKRTASEIGRASILTISMGTINGIIILGTPGGTRMPKKPKPCLLNPITRVMIKMPQANAPVTTTWLVIV